MRYLCLVYQSEESLDALSRAEREAISGDLLAFDEELRHSGRFVVANVLQPELAATTVRVRHGRVTIADGPYNGAAEQLGAFYLIEARDLNDAIRVAARMPLAQLGSVELRPIVERVWSKTGGGADLEPPPEERPPE
jgi:hypothetical protein